MDGLTEIEHKKHLTSMVHQFKLARQNPEVKVHYVIPEANPGYQMMLRSGKNLGIYQFAFRHISKRVNQIIFLNLNFEIQIQGHINVT